MAVVVLTTTKTLMVSVTFGYLISGKRLILCLPLIKVGRKTGALQANQSHLSPWKGHGHGLLEPISNT